MYIEKICNDCENTFQIDDLSLSESFYYASLPLCVIDAVFSIGVKYTATKNVVQKYCQYFVLQEYDCESRVEHADHTISNLIENIRSVGVEKAANVIFQNRQRTSSRNGLLKAEAVLRFAEVLHKNGIDTFADIPAQGISPMVEAEIEKIPGQKSGLSYRYFCMLAGDDHYAKPDRHVIRFLKRSTGKQFTISEAQSVLTEVADRLTIKHPNISVRLLDHAIWDYMAHPKKKGNAIAYNKFVRDRIPEIIGASGKTCVTEVLTDGAYLEMIDAKLDEELAEYHRDQNIEELADLIEVIHAAVIARGYTLEDLERVRAEKAAQQGGFQKKILLKEVIE